LVARAVLSADAGLLVITANMQSETGFPSSHQLKSCVTSKSRLKLAARALLSVDAGLLVLSNGANCTVLRAIVLTQYWRVSDGRTDGRTDRQTCCS